MNHCPGNIGLI